MTQIAVSSCDRDRADSLALLVIEPETRTIERYSLGVDGVSARGLARDDSHLYCAYVHERRSFLAILERSSLRLEERIALPFVRDIHSIALDGTDVLAVSTGDDRIVRFDPRSGRHETIWRAAEGETDIHHVNALAWFRGHLLCSAFGPKMGPAWADAMDGYIYDLTTGTYPIRAIYHPHSIANSDEALYFCESALGKVREGPNDVRYLRGYARGLAIGADGVFYTASSVARRRSGSDFVIDNPSDAGASFGRCEFVFGPRGGPVERIDLAGVAGEIYDVIVLT